MKLPKLIELSLSTFVLFAPGVIFTGCETTSPAPTTATNEPRRQYHSFTASAVPTEGPASDPGAVGRLGQTVHDAVIAALVAKGYTEAPPESADLHVNLRAEFKPDLLSETTEQRKLTIEIIDQKTKRRVWLAERGRSASLTMPPEEVRKNIMDMLAPFPQAPSKQ